jgi:hypothetical protein
LYKLWIKKWEQSTGCKGIVLEYHTIIPLTIEQNFPASFSMIIREKCWLYKELRRRKESGSAPLLATSCLLYQGPQLPETLQFVAYFLAPPFSTGIRLSITGIGIFPKILI